MFFLNIFMAIKIFGPGAGHLVRSNWKSWSAVAEIKNRLFFMQLHLTNHTS